MTPCNKNILALLLTSNLKSIYTFSKKCLFLMISQIENNKFKSIHFFNFEIFRNNSHD